MNIYNLSVKGYPKPRGKLGRYGNMTHSSGDYRDWQLAVTLQLQRLGFSYTSKHYAIAYLFHWSDRNRGRKPDGGNLRGGMEDAMVAAKLIKDDSFLHLPRNIDFTLRASYNAVQVITLNDELDCVKFFLSQEQIIKTLDIQHRRR